MAPADYPDIEHGSCICYCRIAEQRHFAWMIGLSLLILPVESQRHASNMQAL